MKSTPKYNLDALGDEEFERLCQSLIQQIIGSGAKIYGMGKDGAREATFNGAAPFPSATEQWSGTWIFQAKYHDISKIGPKDARNAILAELDAELSKIVEKYNYTCDNYILLTNVSLTPVFQIGTKDKIDKQIIPRYNGRIKNIQVLGAEEICRFLDSYADIRQAFIQFLVTGDIITRLLGLVEQDETKQDELVKSYCQGCYSSQKYAILDDAGDVDDDRILLPNVFVDLDVSPNKELNKTKEVLERSPLWLKQAADDENRKSALSYLLDDSIPGLVIMGGPGQGKSTLCQYIAQVYRARITGHLKELGESSELFEHCLPRIPFRIILREYAQVVSKSGESKSIVQYISDLVSNHYGEEIKSTQIFEIVKTNPTLLILDGLDEIPEKKLRIKVIDNINGFIDQINYVFKGNMRVIATTRPYGYSKEFDPEHYLHLALHRFNPEKALSYANLWTKMREPNKEEATRIFETFKTCMNDDAAKVLTQSPLQVTILLVTIRARGTLPKQIEELFESYMEIIYIREQKKRPELLRSDKDRIYGLHKYLGYILHKNAGQESTAALMDISDFRKTVETYLIHDDPLMDDQELKIEVDQIITEASQRLVLIQSPQEGKIGFELPIIREFFAASHMVDTSADTKERDLRFKSIVLLPHWRNVALFFAGRVGRTRGGEVPSMVNVCGEVDLNNVDKFLKRGAEFILKMVDDRVLREPHNEAGAIYHGLTLLESIRLAESSELTSEVIEIMKDFRPRYKESIIRPWMEDKFCKFKPEKVIKLSPIYIEIFGVTECIKKFLRESWKNKSVEYKLFVLVNAIRNDIIEPWVIDLLIDLDKNGHTKAIITQLRDSSIKLSYHDFSKLDVVVKILLISFDRYGFLLGSQEHKEADRESLALEPNRAKIYVWLFYELSGLLRSYPRVERRSVSLRLPLIAHPSTRDFIKEKKDLIEIFCNSFSEEQDIKMQLLMALVNYLINPYDYKNYVKVVELANSLQDNHWGYHLYLVSQFIGMPHDNDEKNIREGFEFNVNFLKIYTNPENNFTDDWEALNRIINLESKKIENHPIRLMAWIESDFYEGFETLLDPLIIIQVKNWFIAHNVNQKPSYLIQRLSLGHQNQELAGFILDDFLSNLDWKNKLNYSRFLCWCLAGPKILGNCVIASSFLRLFEDLLFNKPASMSKKDIRMIEELYFMTINTGLIKEIHLEEMYKLDPKIECNPIIFSRFYGLIDLGAIQNMLESPKEEVFRFATSSILALRSGYFHKRNENMLPWYIGEKYWLFVKQDQSDWTPIYIRAMSCCLLKWSINHDEWLQAIKGADTEKLKEAWAEVILKAGCYEEQDRKALLDIIIKLLESSEQLDWNFGEDILNSSIKRLERIVSENVPTEIDEASLNLPLAQRQCRNSLCKIKPVTGS